MGHGVSPKLALGYIFVEGLTNGVEHVHAVPLELAVGQAVGLEIVWNGSRYGWDAGWADLLVPSGGLLQGREAPLACRLPFFCELRTTPPRGCGLYLPIG
jgi:hypothetical protein